MLTEQRFLKEVEQHVMEIHRDDGLYRHIRFRRPGTMCMHFDLITWPGYLCYCGDMGTYVFCRLADMFEFFRTDRKYAERHGRQLGINLSYWSEKLIAVDGSRRNGSATEFSEEKLVQTLKQIRLRWIRDAAANKSLTKEQRRALWEAVDEDVLARLHDDGEQAAYLAARDFNWTADGMRPSYSYGKPVWCFEDLWDYDFTVYTRSFTWCCFALAWGIQKYDESKTMKEAA